MIQVFDIQVPSNIPIRQAFTKIYGMGPKNANIFCNWLGLPKSVSFNNLSLHKQQFIDEQITFKSQKHQITEFMKVLSLAH